MVYRSVTKLMYIYVLILLYTFQYCTYVTKYDRHGYKSRKRALYLTDQALYVVDEKDYKIKDNVPYEAISGKLHDWLYCMYTCW